MKVAVKYTTMAMLPLLLLLLLPQLRYTATAAAAAGKPIMEEGAVRAGGLLLARYSSAAAAGEAAAAAEAAKPQFLLMKASYPPYHWSPPKGHVDGDEDFIDAAVRETREETGINPEDIQVVESFHTDLRWVDVEEGGDMLGFDTMKEMLQKADTYLQQEQQQQQQQQKQEQQ
ncbi:bis(5'-nucleosyl)-tetraphosphatase (asymmetrical), putative [Eimeria maxima]|uniref:Bis(5'-nucleosyl)-tetraphosphatase (Asymmetrical), putative n=1 Tax=Eimeria maxima TaxID=5804 RepID=U6LWG4_EIMMA|nr:bis(5'-nucleosyl)-tetraphosphatase (asymmetrical), putative [Eimeria maxima]CDJ56307.1 bis(5'-nucleosyl)-tetraphosphatase (asymmetrical), putative [Eimeria maxima]